MERRNESRHQCPDCLFCQGCSETRCRVCRDEGHGHGHPELGRGFTLGAYEAWKRKRYREKDAGY